MKSLKYLIIFFVILANSNLKAATGCEIGNNIYTVLNGNIDVTIIIVVSVRNYDSPSLSSLPSACPRAINIVPVSGGLGVRTCVANGFILPLGTVVNYDRLDPPVQCDLDDYTLSLIATTGILGLLGIRKRNGK